MLESLFGTSDVKTEINSAWYGVHFSLDGKKLLKYMEVPNQTKYQIPDGTVEIGNNAFFMPSLKSIIIPESVTTIRNGAFVAKGGVPLFVKLPNSLKKLPSDAFLGGYYDEDDDLDDSCKYYYVATTSCQLAEQTSCSSYSKGEQCPIYIGGPLSDLSTKVKSYAVRGFLYAKENSLVDMREWETSYYEHIKENENTYIKMAISNKYLLNLMVDKALLSAKGVAKLLKEIDSKAYPAEVAVLLSYQNDHRPTKMTAGTDPLSDDSPEMKRLIVQEKRREQINEQKRIAGIVFVATGNLDHFGYADEYTSAHDLSDLKEFIEARGGFLRGAVSGRTDYLICNDPHSTTAKFQRAKEFGVPVITEIEFLHMCEE